MFGSEQKSLRAWQCRKSEWESGKVGWGGKKEKEEDRGTKKQEAKGGRQEESDHKGEVSGDTLTD